MKSIEFIIDPQGNVKTTTKGYQGQSCKAASKPYETALGGEIVGKDQDTAEMHQTGTQAAQLGQG